MNSLLLSILAILCADYLLQSEENAATKDSLKLTAFLWHGVKIFGVILFFLHGYQWLTLIGYATIITGAHLLIDLLVNFLNRIKKRNLTLLVFIVSQVIHIAAIFVIWSWIDLQANQEVVSFYERIFRVNHLTSFAGVSNSEIKFVPERFLMGAIVYLYVSFGGSILIDKFLLWLRKREDFSGDKTDHTGKWIGILERIIVLSLILNDALGSVAFILTAKSIARFRELHNRDFAEYYLIGTLASTMLAIGGGFILNYLMTIV